MKYILILLSLILYGEGVFAKPVRDAAKYQIRVLGMNVGEFAVTQELVDGDLSVEAVTDIEVKIIFTYKVRYTQQSHYQNGNLSKYRVQTLKNGSINSDTQLKRMDEAYLLIKDGDSTLVHENITYSGSLLYFNEPKQDSLMYNERNGEMKSIRATADNTYVITDRKGRRTNEYHYKDGILETAILEHPIATIYMERSHQN
ncbi:DUF6134 family protein [Sunxiuqinia dokdonensis]|nr:DUF6134 family protein [Sunxiuqinia dokdonensis]